MTIEEILKGAPDETATHYNQAFNYFKNLDVESDRCEMWDPYNQEWMKTYICIFDVLKPL